MSELPACEDRYPCEETSLGVVVQMHRLRLGGLGMLFMHEVHKVRGRAEDDFEAAFRDGWMPMLGTGDDARLLWYTNHAHGSGPAYTVVTVTAVRDGMAWERLALRIQKGDLQKLMRDLDELRHDGKTRAGPTPRSTTTSGHGTRSITGRSPKHRRSSTSRRASRRLWESPDELHDRFHLEVVPSPSGVTHHLFWRRLHQAL
jgi:hypothetical protein